MDISFSLKMYILSQDGDDAENLVEDETNTEEANEETEANEDATEEAENEETEEQVILFLSFFSF